MYIIQCEGYIVNIGAIRKTNRWIENHAEHMILWGMLTFITGILVDF